uniref:Capsid protein n=1 Tax=Moroccan pepper virus TaxID=208086 RepID=D2CM02_9TOMB|nr:coat protein [Moroccan pepper virus]
MAMVVRNNNTALVPYSGGKRGLQKAFGFGATIVGQKIYDNRGKIVGFMVEQGKKGLSKMANALGYGNGQKAQNLVGGMGGAIMAPVALSRQLRGSKPRFTGRTAGSVTVTHREYVRQVNNTSAFTVNGGIVGNLYQLNPLNGTLFTWLPSIASNFDQYSFNNITLHYVPLCSTTEVGRVGLYYDKDSQDPEPTDRQELANFSILKETPPWGEVMLRIPTDKIKRYCDDSNAVDHKLIDLGQVGIATYGGAGANAVGDVFISYSITLFSPQPTSSLLSTRQQSLLGATGLTTGPSYLTVSSTATVLTLTFRATGTFMVSGHFRDTGAAVLGLAGNINVNSLTVLDTVGLATSFSINCSVSALPSTITFTSTAITSSTVHCVRAVRANDATLL